MSRDAPSVLIACEFSGIVRDAFIRRGINAISCDFLEAESDMGQHYQGDIRDILMARNYELIIAHPSCQFLSNSGVRWLYKDGSKAKGINPVRWKNMGAARDFFMLFYDHPARHICIENPVPHGHAGLPPFTQSVQPWQFGHGEVKRTCFWLKNLPPLRPTNIVDGREPRVHHASPGPDRWKDRSRTFTGIANAMAEQWGPIVSGWKK